MLVDTFMFYNELDILELRLETLDPYVDLFVLVEAEVNHVGGPKELFFHKNKDRFAKWLPKIKYVLVTAAEAPKDESPWAREKYQREAILRGLDGVPDSAIVMVSDVDEIPDMRVIKFEQLPSVVTSVHMTLFQYSFKYINTSEPWIGTVVTTTEIFRRFGANYLRDNRWKFTILKDSGWHLSSFGSPAHVLNKYLTYAHAKDTDTKPTLDECELWVTKGLQGDGKPFVRTPADFPLPGTKELRDRLF